MNRSSPIPPGIRRPALLGKPVNTKDAKANLDRIDDFAKITPLATSYLSRYRGLIWGVERQ
jgi:hypothetical protein